MINSPSLRRNRHRAAGAGRRTSPDFQQIEHSRTSASSAHRNTAHHSVPARISWALKRVFDIDIEQCPPCGGTLKIIAVANILLYWKKDANALSWASILPKERIGESAPREDSGASVNP